MKETVTLVTCGSAREAKKIASALVREKLAACANVVPGITSIYRWKGKIEQDREWLLILKSRAALSRRLAARVRALHRYEVPEVVTLPIVAGNPAYLRWVRASTR
jgi:periplasmic divalent cation tolerance protein